MSGLVRGCGRAQIVAGALFVLLNGLLTPLLDVSAGEMALRTSPVYLTRMSGAVIVALLLLFGSVGLHLRQRQAAGRFGGVAFLVAFVGTALLLAVEWTNLFVLPSLARVAPESLEPLDDALLYNVAFATSAGVFALGWILLSVSLWRSRSVRRWAAGCTLAGLLAVPLLGGPLGVPGMVVGNLILGAGLIGLGLSLLRDPVAP